jgi:hypothetical protein
MKKVGFFGRKSNWRGAWIFPLFQVKEGSQGPMFMGLNRPGIKILGEWR